MVGAAVSPPAGLARRDAVLPAHHTRDLTHMRKLVMRIGRLQDPTENLLTVLKPLVERLI